MNCCTSNLNPPCLDGGVHCIVFVGMQGAVFFAQGFAQPVQICMVVFFNEETGLAIVFALHNVQRNNIEMDALAAGHDRTLPQVKKKFEHGFFNPSLIRPL